ncbi:MAG: DUF2335 domain-containing protein [Eubacterium sp.]|nr:DUF2335 domain-containing protein [Eubacterium sp.]MCM1215755.1 DUF2335 domain-containing protein [Lachnospiraceae bacterium]MCM1305528.1 DUF2335 domain-containing protein [Butyrivibrio sp.]MCM1344783.1 DUF2335 domain-containing protein [Muribaculaceae bacterium]MCM1238319.1 DUF2335 domain-containing protein [Lachnospiraceae bacterium]
MLEKPLEESFKAVPEFEDASDKEVGTESVKHMEDVALEAQKTEENVMRSEPDAVNLDNPEKMARVVAKVIEREFHGPIPSPDIMSGYEDIMPGATDRIIAMAEKQSGHRQSMEAIQVRAESRDSLLGVIFAFMLGMGCLAACVIMVINVPNAAGAICGSVLGVTGISAIITAFLQNTRKQNKEGKNSEKEKQS